MFEKEAEEYLKKDGTKAEQIFNMLNEISPLKITSTQATFIIAMIKQVYQDGAEFGYNKGFEFGVKSNEKVNQIVANEWHYVKDGDLPKENKKYWILTSDGEPKVDSWLSISWATFYGVIAWKEIVLPELKENK